MMQKHIPVMLDEVIASLAPSAGKVYVDATFGNGGYSEAILNKAECKVVAIDRDPNVCARADELKKVYGKRFEFCSGCFSDIDSLVKEDVDGIVFDIGVSSMQLDEADRGFSYAKEAKLDMRMSCQGVSAFDLVNKLSEKELADLIYNYGEERKSRQIASKIVEARKIKPIQTTTELADIVHQVLYKKNGAPDPATRTFQALRIAVNDELSQLEQGLKNGLKILREGGRMVVVTFHSLEDRIVKNFFAQNTSKKVHVSRYGNNKNISKSAFTECSKAIFPSAEEIAQNSRAHSAKLRYATKSMEVNDDE